MKKRRSISKKLISYIMIAQIIFVTLIVSVVLGINMSGEHKTYITYNEIILENKVQEIENFIDLIVDSAETLVMNEDIWNEVILSDIESIEENTPFYDNVTMIMSNFYYSHKGIEYVYLYFPKNERMLSKQGAGIQLDSIDSSKVRRDDVASQEWYSLALQNTGKYVFSVDNNNHLIMTIAINNPYTKSISHVVSYGINKEIFGTLLDNAITASEQIALFDPEGSNYYASNDQILDNLERINDKISSNQSLKGNFRINDGAVSKTVVYGMSTEYKWIIAKQIPTFSIFSTITYSMTAFLFICLILTYIFLVLSKRNIKNMFVPLNELAVAMGELDKDNLAFQNTYEKEDEIGELYEKYEDLVNRLNYYIEHEHKMLIQQKQLQIEAIQRQVNPHFIYNILQMLTNISIQNGDTVIEEICDAFAMLLRYNMANENQQVLVIEEMEAVDKYLYLLQKRYDKRLEIERYVQKECEECKIIPFIIQPLLENSINHGLKNKPGKWKLGIKVYKEENWLVFEVEDNGIGMGREIVESLNSDKPIDLSKDVVGGKGMGLVLFRLRDVYRENCKIEVESYFNIGTRIWLKIPYLK